MDKLDDELSQASEKGELIAKRARIVEEVISQINLLKKTQIKDADISGQEVMRSSLIDDDDDKQIKDKVDSLKKRYNRKSKEARAT